jgi:iron(III) transport system permease protein
LAADLTNKRLWNAGPQRPAHSRGYLYLVPALLLVGFFVVSPLSNLVVASFHLGAWHSLFADPMLADAVVNSIGLGAVEQLISLGVGTWVAWLLARSDIPGSRWLEFGFWTGLFMPPLSATLAWLLLLGGSSGWVNRALSLLPFVQGPLFNLYSWWGIVWVHLVTSGIAFKVFLLTPLFAALNSSLTESARASGARPLQVLYRVIVPAIGPALVLAGLIGLIRSMQSFEVELVLGQPIGVDVYSTVVYRAMTREPPLQSLASVLAIAFVASVAPLVVMQLAYARGACAQIGGKFQFRRFPLGRWRWPAFGVITVLLLLIAVTPGVFLALSTFMRIFGLLDMAHPWTADNWSHAIADRDVLRACWNTMRLGLLSAVLGTAVFSGLAYLSLRARSRLAGILDFLTWLPILAPGMVLGLGLLEMFSSNPALHPLYGTIWTLVIAVLLSTMTVGTQLLRTSLAQTAAELEEAAWASGASRRQTMRRILAPMITQSLAVVALEIFATANGIVGVIALLGTGPMQPLSILQLNLFTSGQLETAGVVGVVIVTLSVASALLARLIGARAGLERW